MAKDHTSCGTDNCPVCFPRRGGERRKDAVLRDSYDNIADNMLGDKLNEMELRETVLEALRDFIVNCQDELTIDEVEQLREDMVGS